MNINFVVRKSFIVKMVIPVVIILGLCQYFGRYQYREPLPLKAFPRGEVIVFYSSDKNYSMTVKYPNFDETDEWSSGFQLKNNDKLVWGKTLPAMPTLIRFSSNNQYFGILSFAETDVSIYSIQGHPVKTINLGCGTWKNDIAIADDGNSISVLDDRDNRWHKFSK